MDRATRRTRTTGRFADTGRLVLAVVGGVLVVEAVRVAVFTAPAEAQAGTRQGAGILNPADQRNEMIQELRALNTRLSTLESAVTGATFDVNVVSMPAKTSGD